MSEDIKHNVFFRERDKRHVLAYVPKGGSWKRPRQVTAPATVKTQAQVKAWTEDQLEKIRAGGGVHLEKTRRGAASLRDLHADLMAVRSGHPDIEAGTIANNWTHLRAQILKVEANPDRAAAIADVPMAEVDVARARAFVRAVRARVSANHCRNIFATCRILWDIAKGEGKVTGDNPFRNQLVISEVPAQKNQRQNPDEPDEPITVPILVCQALFDAPDEVVPLERRARYALDATSGLDEGELSGLRWRQIVRHPAPTPFLKVRQSLGMRTKDGFAKLKDTKTSNRVRDLPLHPAAIAALEAWVWGWERLVRRKPKEEDFVFVWQNGTPQRHKARAELLRRDITAVVAAEVARGGRPSMSAEAIAEVTFKSLRRTFSSALKNADVDSEDRGKLMGHSGDTVTARNYTRHELERLSHLIARIPLTWGSGGGLGGSAVDPSVATAPEAPQTSSDSGGGTSMIAGTSPEARIGFEPTYDGFAKGTTTVGADGAEPVEEGNSDAEPPRGNGFRRGNGEPRASESVGPTAIFARVEVDGVIVETRVRPGEPRADVVDRLALALQQRGVNARRRGDAGLEGPSS